MLEDVPTAVISTFFADGLKKHPSDSLLSCSLLYILMSLSKKTKEPELSEVLTPRCSVFLFKGYVCTRYIFMGKSGH